MEDDKVLWDYGIQERGVVYVINARQYAKEMSPEDAEKRINEIRHPKK